MIGLERILSIGLGVLCLVVVALATYGIVLLKRFGGDLSLPNKKAKPLPKHKVDLKTIDERWVDESFYEKMLERTYQEIQHSILHQDKETLEIVSQGTAQELFMARLQQVDMGSDKREVLQGSIRQSWDPASKKLVTLLAVTRWAKGWKRFYEEWTLQRQGNAWFVVAARPSRL